MYCEKCNKYFSEDKSFCNVCGGELKDGNEKLSKRRTQIEKDGITPLYAVMLIVSAIVVAFIIALTYNDKWVTLEAFSKLMTENRISFSPMELWDEVKEYSSLLETIGVEEWKITALNVSVGAMSVLNIMAMAFSVLFVLTALFKRRTLMVTNAIISFLSYTIAVIIALTFVKIGNGYISGKTLGTFSLGMIVEKNVLYSAALYAIELVCAIVCTVICKAKRLLPIRIFKK